MCFNVHGGIYIIYSGQDALKISCGKKYLNSSCEVKIKGSLLQC